MKTNSDYGDYLPNLTLEEINTQKVSDAVDNLTLSFIRQARIRGVQDLITQKASEIAEATAEVTEKTSEALRESSRFSSSGLNTTDSREQIANLGLNLDDIQERVRRGRAEISKGIISTEVTKETRDLSNELARLEAQLQNLISQDFDLGGIFSGGSFQEAADSNPIRLKVEPISSLQATEALANISNK